MKNVLVTGGARGIGRAIVEELASHDYKITATYHSSQKAADEIATKFPNVHFIAVDLGNRNELESFIKGQLKSEPIEVLINNAGAVGSKAFEKMTKTELYQQVDVNLAAPARLIQGLLPVLKKTKHPLVINISSQAATARLTGEAMYSAVKAALSTLSYILRAELNSKGIRVVAVEPFGVNTYGIPEPSNIIKPEDLAKVIRQTVELPDHLQVDTISLSHINQARPNYPEWIEK